MNKLILIAFVVIIATTVAPFATVASAMPLTGNQGGCGQGAYLIGVVVDHIDRVSVTVEFKELGYARYVIPTKRHFEDRSRIGVMGCWALDSNGKKTKLEGPFKLSKVK